MFTQNAGISRPGVSAITYKQSRSPQHGIMKRDRYYLIPTAVMAAIGVARAAVGFYEVRELLAALLMFSLIFCIVGIALLIVFLIQEVALQGLNRLEARAVYVRASYSGASDRPDKNRISRSPRWS
jgi:hypothetical protein